MYGSGDGGEVGLGGMIKIMAIRTMSACADRGIIGVGGVPRAGLRICVDDGGVDF